MKRVYIFILMLVFLVTFSLSITALELTARSLGMGGTFTGVANDITTVIYNPAGINQVGSMGVNVDGGVRVSNIKELGSIIELISELEPGMDLDDLDKIKELEENLPEDFKFNSQLFAAGNFRNLGLSLKLDNNVFVEDDKQMDMKNTLSGIFTYGNEIVAPFLNLGTIAYGVNLKAMGTTYDKYRFEFDAENPDDDLINSARAQGIGYGIDAGLLMKFTNLIQVGVQARDLYTPEYQLTVENGNDSEGFDFNPVVSEPVLRTGAAVTIPVLNARLAADIDNIVLTGIDEQNFIYHFGIEKHMFFNLLALRAGYIEEDEDTQFYTAGLGINFLTAEVNAAIAADSSLGEDYMLLLSGKIQF